MLRIYNWESSYLERWFLKDKIKVQFKKPRDLEFSTENW